jgi:hypothetical protein
MWVRESVRVEARNPAQPLAELRNAPMLTKSINGAGFFFSSHATPLFRDFRAWFAT